MYRNFDKKIVLENGQEFYGYSFGASGSKVLEIVFNTSMTGYQEIISDPSYTGQAVVMTYPLIGNYGIADEDFESAHPTSGALAVREYCDQPSNFRCVNKLSDVMKKYDIVGIYGIDTRRLTRTIRDFGTMKCLITDSGRDTQKSVEMLNGYTLPRDQVRTVSCRETVSYGKGGMHVVVIDCGAKSNIVNSLVGMGCSVTKVPWNSSADYIMGLKPDGVLISNGPGDPSDVPETVETVKKLTGKVPVFGICLGHQILALSYGASTYKLKFGHRGGNHPVKEITSGSITITSQNHSYAVSEESLALTPLKVTHINLLDGTVEGLSCEKDMAFSVQYHPESAPGPQDSRYLFGRFLKYMENGV